MSIETPVEFYQRMKNAERQAGNAKTDLVVATQVIKKLRERIHGLETALDRATEEITNGDFEKSRQVLQEALATVRRKK